MRVYRIAYRRYASTPLDGEGSFLYGGRWASAGTRMAYTSSTVTLAMLEFLSQVDIDDFDPSQSPELAYIAADIPDSAVLTLPEIGVALPKNWDDIPAPAIDAAIGDAWAGAARSLARIECSIPARPIGNTRAKHSVEPVTFAVHGSALHGRRICLQSPPPRHATSARGTRQIVSSCIVDSGARAYTS